MKRYIYLLGALLLFCSNVCGQQGVFDPSNPPEPNAQYNLVLQASPVGAGSFYGAGKYTEGSSVYVYAYNNSGFRFLSWKKNGNVISTSSSFNYTMPAGNDTLTAFFEYAPDNPGEPNPTPQKYKLNLVAQPSSGGYFNISSGNKHEEGSSVYLYAYTNTGFKFSEWRDDSTVISTNRNFYYTMPSENKTITAVYYYDPDAPNEPNTPTDVEHGLIALNQSGDAGQTIAFPIYLLNHNIDVHSVEFDIAFPEGATVDYENAILTSRGNGQTVSAVSLGNNVFHYTIVGESDAPFFDSNGILIRIPVTLPVQWIPEEAHPVTFENVQIGAQNGTMASSGRAGSLSINPIGDYTVLAGFYPNKFLNRVHFINLSSETATSFEWNFGDGTMSVDREPLHVYETSGNYEVRLIASNVLKADTVSAQLEIAAEHTWNISGTISLNKHKKNMKNFTSVEELFLLLSRSTIDGNITIDVEANEIFEWNLSAEAVNILTLVKNRMAESKQTLLFHKDGASDNPVISFRGTASAESFLVLVQLGQYIELNGVEIRIFDQPVDIRQIYSYTSQKVCSGTASAPVDFTKISSLFTYGWTLVSSPASTSGYPVSGSDSIPSATLTTVSSATDTLVYKVSILSVSPAVELYSFEYKILVLPTMQGELILLSPEANQTLNSSTVTFAWSEMANASYYEIKVWEEYDDEPETVMATNIKSLSWQISSFFQYGKKYNFRVIAVNECKRIESEAVRFAIRFLPDLHVTAIEAPATFIAGAEVKIIIQVKNDGQGATLATERWYDKAGIIKDMKNPNTSVYWLAEKQNKSALASGESYTDTLTLRIPERLSGDWYVVVTSDMANILSIDWSPAGNVVPLPYTPNKNGIPYPYLKAQTSYYGNLIQEDKETATMTDNFFYTVANIKIAALPDLQISSIELPVSVIENHTFTARATITNAGDTILSGKTWSDGIWQSKSPGFNTSTASLVAFVNSSHALGIGESYTVSFELTAPLDSMVNYYYFVTADLNDNVYESDETNNRLCSDSVLVQPSLMNEDDYANLVRIFNEFGGESWTNKWQISSNRIANHWRGVTFDQGRVKTVSLAFNNLAGELSDVFFKFPYINSLNLYDNKLTGSLNLLLTSESVPDSLVSLNLGKNQLEGTVPATIAGLEYLEELNLSNNRLSEIESVLPQTIVRLNIQSQILPSDSIALSSQPVLNIPSIARYNHANGSFDAYPSYGVYRNSEYVLGYVYNGSNYVWQLNQSDPKNFIWYYEPEYEFSLAQESGLAQGSTSKLKMGFMKGDANIDLQVDVLDVQHSLNYIFNEHVSAFNFTAADTYKDNAVTVQDLIKTVNIIMDSGYQEQSMRSTSANMLYISNGKLIIYTEQAVAAIDITIQGISEKEILPMLADSQFQFIFRDTGNGTRFIAFSPAGGIIPPGSVEIAKLHNSNAVLRHAVLSSPAAERIPVTVIESPTDMIPVETDNITAFVSGGNIYYYIPDKAALISASLYSTQGIVLEKQVFNNEQPEQPRLDFKIGQAGAYILNLAVKSDNRIISKNIKLIITK
jgi:PKD repeat protein